jgi:BirA family transcriptional regulator, biotin operon repressor / biotin---[acetyl-CoA-carboxylase] ligase
MHLQEQKQQGDCRSVRYFRCTDSTNTAACQELAAGRWQDAAALPRLYLADRQSAGRGRLGRRWLADQGTLTFSVIYDVGGEKTNSLHAPALPLVALATGVGIARAIEYLAAPLSARIKWPNDVHVGGGKVAGILVESVGGRPDRLVVGVGLNVATALENFADQIASPASSLSQVARGPAERHAWLPELLAQMRSAYQQLCDQPQQLLDELRARCLLTGSEVRYQQSDTIKRGTCIGVDQGGALLIQDGGIVENKTRGGVGIHGASSLRMRGGAIVGGNGDHGKLGHASSLAGASAGMGRARAKRRAPTVTGGASISSQRAIRRNEQT